MGMLVTLCLISCTVYIAVDAPPHRGFSYIELWFLGTQLPILFAMVEYSMILGCYKIVNHKRLKVVNIKVISVAEMGTKMPKLSSSFNMDRLFFLIDVFSFLISASFMAFFSLCYITIL